MLVILVLTRRIADAPAEERPELDVVGAVLSALGLALLVFGVLRSSEWGWIQPKPDGPSWAGLSPTVWLILGGLFVIWLFFRWQNRREPRRGAAGAPGDAAEPATQRRTAMFFFQYLVQAGLFFVVPLYLSVCLGLSALAHRGPAAAAVDHAAVAAIGIPRFLPHVSPRLVVRGGLLALLAGTVVLLGGARPGLRAGGRLRADAAHRARHRRAGVAARRRDRLGRARTTRAPRSAGCRTR